MEANKIQLHILEVYSTYFCSITWFCKFILWMCRVVQKEWTWIVFWNNWVFVQ